MTYSRRRSCCGCCWHRSLSWSPRCCRWCSAWSRAICWAAPGLKADEGHGGGVTLIQRFGSAAIHPNCLVLDGVYRSGAEGVPVFIDAGVPTDDELHALLQRQITRLTRLLTRRGVLVEDMGQTYRAEPGTDEAEARTLRPLQAAASTYRIAFGPRAGHKVLTLRGAMPRECVWRPASGSSSCAATSFARRCPTNGLSATPPGRWS